MTRPTCSGCYYFESEPDPPLKQAGWGECHRHAPKASRHFPNVKDTDWCGEWWSEIMDAERQDATCSAPKESASSVDHGTT